MATYYKVLRRHEDGTLRSCHGGSAIWSEPKRIGFSTYEPGEPVFGHARSALCSSGIHLTTDPLKWLNVMPVAVFLAEPIGPSRGQEGDKHVFDGARLTEPVEAPFWWLEVEAFVAGLPKIKYLENDGNPLPEWNVYETGDAAWDAARDAARDAAGAAAGDAARAAARDAAWDAAGDAARAAARDAAWAAAWYAARDAARDASLFARVLSCGGLPLATEHIRHATARMEVWRKGYGLYCDVGGKLFVYKQV